MKKMIKKNVQLAFLPFGILAVSGCVAMSSVPSGIGLDEHETAAMAHQAGGAVILGQGGDEIEFEVHKNLGIIDQSFGNKKDRINEQIRRCSEELKDVKEEVSRKGMPAFGLILLADQERIDRKEYFLRACREELEKIETERSLMLEGFDSFHVLKKIAGAGYFKDDSVNGNEIQGCIGRDNFQHKIQNKKYHAMFDKYSNGSMQVFGGNSDTPEGLEWEEERRRKREQDVKRFNDQFAARDDIDKSVKFIQFLSQKQQYGGASCFYQNEASQQDFALKRSPQNQEAGLCELVQKIGDALNLSDDSRGILKTYIRPDYSYSPYYDSGYLDYRVSCAYRDIFDALIKLCQQYS